MRAFCKNYRKLLELSKLGNDMQLFAAGKLTLAVGWSLGEGRPDRR